MESGTGTARTIASPKSALSRRAVYSALFILATLLLFFVPEIPSQAQVNITDKDAVLAAVEFKPISRLNITREELANLEINVQSSNVEYSFALVHNPDDFSLNYIFVPPGTSNHKASELLAAIPGADAVSAYDEKTGMSQGYIALRGGRGKNFPIKPFRVYEVSVTRGGNFTFTFNK